MMEDRANTQAVATEAAYPFAPRAKGPETHELKCWPEFFVPVIEGSKPFEIRKNDRKFRVGDILHLREYTPCEQCKDTGVVPYTPNGAHPWVKLTRPCACVGPDSAASRYTGKKALFVVTYITEYKQRAGYVVLGIRPKEDASRVAVDRETFEY